MTTTKKKAGRTHIVMVLDRSGSMSSIKSDMEGAINEYVKDQQKVDGECTFTFAQFDTEHEVLLSAVDLQGVFPLFIVLAPALGDLYAAMRAPADPLASQLDDGIG